MSGFRMCTKNILYPAFGIYGIACCVALLYCITLCVMAGTKASQIFFSQAHKNSIHFLCNK